MTGAREGRRIWDRAVMGERREGDRFFGILGQILGTPRWADEPVVAVAEAGKRQWRGRRDIGRQEKRVGRVQ